MTDPIEGESRELVPVSPTRLSDVGPEQMVVLASRLATVLKAVVDKQKLFALIQGKKYPTVEAWETIARMDNVVAQEESVVRQDDGSYVATVQLVRLSDGSVVGRASAMCGSADDRPWNGRAAHNRRSMAVTRAVSRAFRMQYSWIMALAGYEVTPAEEMPYEAPRPVAVESNAPAQPSAADMADLDAPVSATVEDHGPASGMPADAMTLTEIQNRAKDARLSVADLNRKAMELHGRTINLLTNDQRLAVAVELGLA